EMEALIQHFLIYSQGFTVPKGESYVPVEGPRGEHGTYIVSDGTNRPARVHFRPASLLACQAMEPMVVGGLIADVIAIIGSTDIVMGDVDRVVSIDGYRTAKGSSSRSGSCRTLESRSRSQRTGGASSSAARRNIRPSSG